MSNEKLNSIFNHIKNLAIDNSSEILDKIDNKLIKKETFSILNSFNIKDNLVDVLKNNDLIVDYPNKVVFNMQQIRIELPRPKERGFLFHWKQP